MHRRVQVQQEAVATRKSPDSQSPYYKSKIRDASMLSPTSQVLVKS